MITEQNSSLSKAYPSHELVSSLFFSMTGRSTEVRLARRRSSANNTPLSSCNSLSSVSLSSHSEMEGGDDTGATSATAAATTSTLEHAIAISAASPTSMAFTVSTHDAGAEATESSKVLARPASPKLKRRPNSLITTLRRKIMSNSLPRRRLPPSLTGNVACRGEGREVALKIIDRIIFADRVKKNQERSDTLVREVLAQILVGEKAKDRGLRESETPVVQIFGAFETLDKFTMELELMDSLDLFDTLQKQPGRRLKEADARQVVGELTQAVLLCQQAGIAHRDIKPSNVCLVRPSSSGDDMMGLGRSKERSGKEEMRRSSSGSNKEDRVKESTSCRVKVKLADFGMAGFMAEDGKIRGRCGTMGYVAPEMFVLNPHDPYENKVDMFSVSTVVIGWG